MQVPPRKRYRFFYPAGLISLVLLPLLGILYLNSKPVFEQQYAMEINTISEKQIKEGYFDHFSLPDPRFSRKYQTIKITGETNTDIQKLRSAQKAIRDMLAKKDTLNGIRLTFESRARYSSLIEGLDICQIENARTYMLLKNNLWVLYINPKSVKTQGYNSFCGGVITSKTEDVISYKQEFDFQKIAKSFWPAGILYIIMLSLTAQKVKRQLRNQ